MSAVTHMGLVKNPLTIIAMFAVIAEVSGAVVLPFLSESVQATYVWFLMLFPFLLVVLFFVTLWIRRDALYGPSDFRDENHFMAALMRPATVTELALKNAADTADVMGVGLDVPPDAIDGRSDGIGSAEASRIGSISEITGSIAQAASEASSPDTQSGATEQGTTADAGPGPSALNEVSATSNFRFARVMERRQFMKDAALAGVVGQFPQVQYDMKVGDLVVDAVAITKDSVSLIESHYVGLNAVTRAAKDDLIAVISAAREFVASTEDCGPVRVFFVLYSEYIDSLNVVAREMNKFAQARIYRGIEIHILVNRISRQQLSAFNDN